MAGIDLKASLQYETLQPYKVELTRGQKGAYGWTITVHSETPEVLLNRLKHIDNELCSAYIPLTPEATED